MPDTLRILMYGGEDQCAQAEAQLMSWACGKMRTPVQRRTDDLDDLQIHVVEWKPKLVLVLADGEDGRDCVSLIRSCHPTIPVFWFSDEDRFAITSHQLTCAYFGLKPVTEKQLRMAFARCNHMGIWV